MKKINYKKLILSIVITLIIGSIGALLGGNMNDFQTINKPSFAPPAILFPIVWSILYILMGISYYLISTSDTDQITKDTAKGSYIFQLIVNVLWTPIFFRFKWYLFAFIWIILLIILVIIMIYKFYKIKPIAGYLQIPYLLWIAFASILNFSIYLLNR